jgi:hypothetical protein
LLLIGVPTTNIRGGAKIRLQVIYSEPFIYNSKKINNTHAIL